MALNGNGFGPPADQGMMVAVPAATVERLLTRGDRLTVLVVDNAHPDPAALIDAAGTASDFTADAGLYPGIRRAAAPSHVDAILRRIDGGLSAVFGLPHEPAPQSVAYSIATADPASLAAIQRIPHIDTVQPGVLAMVHYLCPADFGGTSFYRHRRTGFSWVDADRLPTYRRALTSDLKNLGFPALKYIEGDTNMFEHTARVRMRFNRAVFYRANGLHSGDLWPRSQLLPDCLRGRLTLNALLS